MIPMFRALFEHLAWADAALLSAIREQEGAFDDEELRKWLHHILVVQRYFLSLFLARPFDMEREREVPGAPDEMERRFHETHRDEIEFVGRLQEPELARAIELPHMAGLQPSLRDLLLQVIMHSEHHRAQCAMRLRALGGKPSVTDYIMWVRTQKGAA